MKIGQQVLQFLKEEDGPTAVEYAVMLSLIIAVCLVSISLVGQNTANMFNDSAKELGDVLKN